MEVFSSEDKPLIVVDYAHTPDALISTFLEAKKDDVILLAGKGHEITQQIGSNTLPFSDRELAKRLTEEHT